MTLNLLAVALLVGYSLYKFPRLRWWLALAVATGATAYVVSRRRRTLRLQNHR